MWLWAAMWLGITNYFGLFLFSGFFWGNPCEDIHPVKTCKIDYWKIAFEQELASYWPVFLQLHCGKYFGTPEFFQTYTQLNLNSWIGGKQASKKPIPVQMQSFNSRIWSFWLVVWPHNGSTRRIEMSGAEKSRLEIIPSTFHYFIQGRNPPKCIQKLTTSNNFDRKNLV